MLKYKFIEVVLKQQVLTIWLNRPEARNALNKAMIDELCDAFKNYKVHPNCRLIILRGKNNFFCAGADIKWMSGAGKLSKKQTIKNFKSISCLLRTIYKAPIPVVSIAQGSVFGGAIGILCASDIVISSESAHFAFPEAKIGLAPSIIMPYVFRRLSVPRAMLFMFTGKVINAKEASDEMLVDFCVGEMHIDKFLNDLINELKRASPNSLKEIKRLSRLISPKISNATSKETVQTLANLVHSKQGQEGMSAFFEKREPFWIEKNQLSGSGND